jgi:hypothetical protein
LRLGFGVLALIAFAHAHAEGGSYNVDDASVVGNGKCQLESWLREWSNGSNGVYTVPACGVGAVELGLSLNTEQRTHGVTANPGAKWQLRNGDVKGIGVAVATNATYLHGHQEDVQAYVSTTFGLDDARRVMVALNAGADRMRHDSTHSLFGAGLSWSLTERWELLVERLWMHRTIDDQGGVRFGWDDSSVDLVIGSERGPHREHWINLGWNVAF